MKKLFIFLAITLLISSISFAQTSVWKVTGKGTTLYLGGTIHLLRSQDFPLPAQFDSAYKMSRIIAFETDMEAMEKPEMAQKLASKVMFTDEKTLQTVLTDTAYKALAKTCSDYGIPIANLAKFKPSMVVLMVSMLKMQQMGFSANGVDKNYFTMAKKDGKTLSFLESVDQQIDFIANMAVGNESDFVMYSLKDLKEMEKDFPDLVTAWRNGLDKEFTKESLKMSADYPAIHKSLVLDRNNNWMPAIEAFLNTPETEFVLVGSLHLYTPDGIIKKLQEKGYKVEQL